MKSNSRATVAFIAARLISGNVSSSIYDYFESRYINISGEVALKSINIYDYDQSCYITGNGNKDAFSLYHYGDGHYIDLKITANQFSGYDYGSSCHFSGNVNENSISFYDYGKKFYFNYSV